MWSTSLYHSIPIIIPYYPILSNTPPTSAGFGFSQGQSKSRLPSRPQSSSVVPECPTLSRFLQSTASAGCPTWIWFPWRILTVLLYMVTWIPSIYPSHVSIFLQAPWIRHGIGYYQKSIFQGGNPWTSCQENYLLRPQSQKPSQLPWPFGHFIHPSRAASFWGRCAWINYHLVMTNIAMV